VAPGRPGDDPIEDLYLGDVVVSNPDPESGHGKREFDLADIKTYGVYRRRGRI
jgi:hypothetical protein